MATEVLGSGGMTNEARTFYVMELLSRAMPYMAHVGWGLEKTIPARGGNNVNFRRFERPTTNTLTPGGAPIALTEGTPPTALNLTVSAVAATVAQYGAFDVVSDVLAQQGIDSVFTEFKGVFAEQMGLTIDVLARNILVAGTNVVYTGTAGSRGALSPGVYLSGTLLKSAARELNRRNARPIAKAGGNYVAFVHPDSWDDLTNDAQIVTALSSGQVRGDGNPLFTGNTFDWAGIRCLRTSNARHFTYFASTCAPAYATVVIGDEAYGEVKFGFDTADVKVKPVGSAGAADPLDQYGTVGWKAAYAAVRLNEDFIQRIEHATAKADTTDNGRV
jgi:N4-gp56 family major capsid protein